METNTENDHRFYYPPKDIVRKANVREYETLYQQSIDDREGFWAAEAKKLDWFKKWDKVLDDSNKPFFKWFTGGKINIVHNALDRHQKNATRNKLAIIWEGEPAAPGKPGEERTLTYKQLHHEVCLFANVLKKHGIKKGDRVLIYLPMVVEAAVAMLACTRIGAVHSVVFGGFSAQSVADRVFD